MSFTNQLITKTQINLIFSLLSYRKNYCKTSEDFIEKMEQWSKEHQSDEDEVNIDKKINKLLSNNKLIP